MSTKINWQEPPAPKNTRGRTWRPQVVEQLKANPGVWALVEERVATISSTHWARLGCEATARSQGKNAEGKYLVNIYARWPESVKQEDEQEEQGA